MKKTLAAAVSALLLGAFLTGTANASAPNDVPNTDTCINAQSAVQDAADALAPVTKDRNAKQKNVRSAVRKVAKRKAINQAAQSAFWQVLFAGGAASDKPLKKARKALRRATKERTIALRQLRPAERKHAKLNDALIGFRLAASVACDPMPDRVEVDPYSTDINTGIDAFPVPPGSARTEEELRYMLGRLGGYAKFNNDWIIPKILNTPTFDVVYQDSGAVGKPQLRISDLKLYFVAAWMSDKSRNLAWIKYRDSEERTCVAPFFATQIFEPICIPGLNNHVIGTSYGLTMEGVFSAHRSANPDIWNPLPTILDYKVGYLARDVPKQNLHGEGHGIVPAFWNVSLPFGVTRAMSADHYSSNYSPQLPVGFIPDVDIFDAAF